MYIVDGTAMTMTLLPVTRCMDFTETSSCAGRFTSISGLAEMAEVGTPSTSKPQAKESMDMTPVRSQLYARVRRDSLSGLMVRFIYTWLDYFHCYTLYAALRSTARQANLD